jgi:hypothetical protein
MDGGLFLNTAALRVPSVGTNVSVNHVHAFNDHALLAQHHSKDLAPFAFQVAGDDLYHITASYVTGHNRFLTDSRRSEFRSAC